MRLYVVYEREILIVGYKPIKGSNGQVKVKGR